MFELPPADPQWLSSRRRLQGRYIEVSEMPDASRLGYLRGPLRRFTEDDFAAQWAAVVHDVNRPKHAQHSVYVHVPFCKSICSFCNYERLRPSEPGLLDAWLERILGTLDVVAPVVQPLTFEALYIGGGTPSTLPPRILSQLLENLDSRLNWHPHSARAFEFDPAVMNAAKLDVLKRHGFTRFSFGIQTLDPTVNAAHNRGAQSVEMVAKRFEELRLAGIEEVAGDILLGLEGTTPASILADIDTLLSRFRPRRLDVFMLTPTHDYVDAHFGGDFESFWAHLKPFQEQIPAALRRTASRNRYVLREGQGHRFQLTRSEPGSGSKTSSPKGSYQGMTSERDRPVQILGLGPSARSQLFGVAAMECRDPGASPGDSGPAWYQGHELDLGSEVQSYLVHRLRDSDHVKRSTVRNLFGANLEELVPGALGGLIAEGLATLTDDALELVPQSRQERSQSLLWFVPEPHLEYELSRRMGLIRNRVEVEKLLGELVPGTHLIDGIILQSIRDDGRLILDCVGYGLVRLRLAPPLDDQERLRLVIEDAPPLNDSLRSSLRRAIARLRGWMAKRFELVKRSRVLNR